MNKLAVLLSILLGLFFIVPIFGYFFTDNFHTCFLKCPGNNLRCKYITYDINGERKKQHMNTPCIFNGWNLSHIMLFAFLTFLFPEYYILLIVSGIIWEITEYFDGLNNWLDILWNIIGVTIGLITRRVLF